MIANIKCLSLLSKSLFNFISITLLLPAHILHHPEAPNHGMSHMYLQIQRELKLILFENPVTPFGIMRRTLQCHKSRIRKASACIIAMGICFLQKSSSREIRKEGRNLGKAVSRAGQSHKLHHTSGSGALPAPVCPGTMAGWLPGCNGSALLRSLLQNQCGWERDDCEVGMFPPTAVQTWSLTDCVMTIQWVWSTAFSLLLEHWPLHGGLLCFQF